MTNDDEQPRTGFTHPDQTGTWEPDWEALAKVLHTVERQPSADYEWDALVASEGYKTSRRMIVQAVITEYLKQLDEAGYEIKKKEDR